ncbi:hypothetical protein GGS23DRAFT_371494 [Durotheca rogersii]|uniref:uncharacterized protein n=1 Tax=Durotheca rogersii TaxID=419775 RepID=UPI00221EF0F5|nr:uncharacterized protein GGS23DRAFT_371494 [Durotheca rogersii]KAI5866156.1 hypothetical protein GGS23DRAFT_371494 [Durotheca rogersii]
MGTARDGQDRNHRRDDTTTTGRLRDRKNLGDGSYSQRSGQCHAKVHHALGGNGSITGISSRVDGGTKSSRRSQEVYMRRDGGPGYPYEPRGVERGEAEDQELPAHLHDLYRVGARPPALGVLRYRHHRRGVAADRARVAGAARQGLREGRTGRGPRPAASDGPAERGARRVRRLSLRTAISAALGRFSEGPTWRGRVRVEAHAGHAVPDARVDLRIHLQGILRRPAADRDRPGLPAAVPLGVPVAAPQRKVCPGGGESEDGVCGVRSSGGARAEVEGEPGPGGALRAHLQTAMHGGSGGGGSYGEAGREAAVGDGGEADDRGAHAVHAAGGAAAAAGVGAGGAGGGVEHRRLPGAGGGRGGVRVGAVQRAARDRLPQGPAPHERGADAGPRRPRRRRQPRHPDPGHGRPREHGHVGAPRRQARAGARRGAGRGRRAVGLARPTGDIIAIWRRVLRDKDAVVGVWW